MTSLRRRMLAWQAIAILVAALLASMLGYELAWRGFNKVRDHGLEQVAYAIVRHGMKSQGRDGAEPTIVDRGQFLSQIWRSDKVLQYASSPDVGPEPQPDGFSDVDWRAEEWRVFSVHVGEHRVQVAVAASRREASFALLLPWMGGLALLLMLVLLFLAQVGANLALKPLARLKHELEQRHPLSLQYVQTDNMPDEIKTLGHTFNLLLARMNAILQEQRRFLSDAAHGLNTPLAVLKLRAQLLPRLPKEELPLAFKELDSSIDRTSRLVIQLLRLVRITPELAVEESTLIDVVDLTTQVVAELAALAQLDGQRVLWLPPQKSIVVRGDPGALRSMIENLIDNALRYSPSGTVVVIEVDESACEVWFQVQDQGPGIPPDQRERALERFVRLAPGDTKGSGLGLNISQAVANQLGGKLCLIETPGGGLTVRVSWPSDPGG